MADKEDPDKTADKTAEKTEDEGEQTKAADAVAAHSGTPWELAIEDFFEAVGVQVARQPWIFILVSVVIVGIFGGGMAILKVEKRPDKQWVPEGAQALSDQDYITVEWPSQQRFNLIGATCPTSTRPAVTFWRPSTSVSSTGRTWT